MKKFLLLIICLSLVFVVSINYNEISDFIASKISDNHTLIIKEKSAFAKEKGFLFVDVTEEYIPYSYNDLLNIIYTTINNHWDTFTFYCAPEYEDCINDIDRISNDKTLLSHIDNFVHPYNSFTDFYTHFSNSGEITIELRYLYSSEEIDAVDKYADNLVNKYTSPKNTDYENIKILHDYIINNTKYDKDANVYGESRYRSKTAYGTFFEGYATCNGYTDAMAVLLSKLGIKNYKIATTSEDAEEEYGHVWNAVYLNNKWLHLDLTWDDPVASNGKDYLYHTYFLISNDELKKADSGDVKIKIHNFNNLIYLEFNDSI